MSLIRVGVAAFPIVPNPPAGKFFIGLDSNNANHLTRQDSAGSLTDYEASATLNINGLTEQDEPLLTSLVPLYDPVLLANRKVQRRELLLTDVDLLSFERSDFIEGATGGLLATISGTGASNQVGTYGIDASNNAHGVTQLDTGTTATGRAALSGASQAQLFLTTGDEYRLDWRVAVEAVSSVTDTFTAYVGFGNMFATAGMTGQFVGFRYTDATNGGKWQALVVVGGVIVDSGDTGALVGTDYFKLGLRMTPTAVEFLVDNVVTNTLTTGLPAGPAQSFTYGVKIEKSVGLTQRNMSLDYYRLAYLRDTAR
jgi:hypothetical protein